MKTIIEVSKKDIIWNYLAVFFGIGSGVIILPLILHFLTAEEVGLNYLMMTISSMVALLDFGFSPQIGRNITYALSGAKTIEKEGLEQVNNPEPNYKLLALVIDSAKYIYKRLSIVILIILFVGGTPYIYRVTHGFMDVNHTFPIWLIFCISSYFNIYFIYYRSLLTGSGQIYESSVSVILSKLLYIVICGLMLLLGCGLFSVVIANLISPFAQVYYSHKKFYTTQVKAALPTTIEKEEVSSAITKIWYNAKKLGINSLGTFAVLKLNLFLIGLFLPLNVVGAFGVLTQIVQTLSSVSSSMFRSFIPQISSLQVSHNYSEIIRKLSFSTVLYWITLLSSGVILILLLPSILSIIHSTIELPERHLCLIYLLIMLLEGNHSNFATVIATSNKIPFVKAGLAAGAVIALFTFLSLYCTNYGLLGVVLVQGIVQLLYNNWKWPMYVLNDLGCDVYSFIRIGFYEVVKQMKRYRLQKK